jgi:hypothetical protein
MDGVWMIGWMATRKSFRVKVTVGAISPIVVI